MRTSLLALLVLVLISQPARAQDAAQAAEAAPADGHAQRADAPAATGLHAVTGARVPCTGGQAGDFGCRNVDLLSFLPIDALGGGPTTSLNDIWGWTDPQTGREYAVVGRSDGTAFVDVTDPQAPVYLGELPTAVTSDIWRDVKVYDHYALVVADNAIFGSPGDGMQIFDLTRLRDVGDEPVTFDDYAYYTGFGRAHNVVVNEETGYAYAVGTNTCGGGLHMMDLADPENPVFVGCYAAVGTGRGGTGYTHDAQCVVYRGPDEAHQGREICFSYNETAIVITDVTDKATPVTLSVARYPTSAYVHQGWLSEDQRYVFQDDELDEANRIVSRTRTLVWDVTDLDDPVLVSEYLGASTSIDHNQYVVGDLNYQANYTSGLRILDVSDPTVPVEVGFFDTYPANDAARDPSSGHGVFEGAWSNYPFFESGVVVVSSIGEGLFVLMPVDEATRDVAAEDEVLPGGFALTGAYPNPFNPSTRIDLHVDVPQHVHLAVYDMLGREVAVLHDGDLAAGTHAFSFDAAGRASGRYFVRALGTKGADVDVVTLAQ